MTDEQTRIASERALITRFMPEKQYKRLVEKYDHDVVFKAWSEGVAKLAPKRGWRERFLDWLGDKLGVN